MKKIDTYESTKSILPPFSLVIRAASLLARKKEHVRIIKKGRLPKPPYLLISTHASFMDFYVSIKATSPHQPYWVSTVEEYIDKDFIFRHLGIIPKRKFTNDPIGAKMMMDVLKERKKILIIYPEARYSFVGKPERIDNGLASMAKLCDVPIVFANCHGHYLRDPQWGDHHVRKVKPLVAEYKCILTRKQVREYPVNDLMEYINRNFAYDEEKYQEDNDIKINYEKRAEGLEKILYKCPHCGKEFTMSSSGHILACNSCGIKYELTEFGRLKCLNDKEKFSKISEWYYWEKDCVKKEVENGTYFFEDDVRVEKLEGVGVGFVPLTQKCHLTQDINNGIKVVGDEGFEYFRSSLQSYAIHIEYDYKNKGGCIDLATPTETYFVYPLNRPKNLTKIHFATELIYDFLKSQLKEDKKE